jgi:hypothetical protein
MSIPEDEVRLARQAIKDQDFVIVDSQLRERDQLEASMRSWGSALGLGKPYVPILYREGKTSKFGTSDGVNDVGGPSIGLSHPGFSLDTELQLHTDGTVEGIGQVRTVLLMCVRPALEGGETVVVRTSRLLECLDAGELSQLAPLFDTEALRRHGTVKLLYGDGPVFSFENERILGRYSVSPRDEWRYDVVKGLARARSFFDDLLERADGIVHRIKLKQGQMLIFDNSRISHARTAFKSHPENPRHLLRALYQPGV